MAPRRRIAGPLETVIVSAAILLFLYGVIAVVLLDIYHLF